MRFKELLGNIGRGISDVWESLDYVPDCPMCGGSGEFTNKPYQFGTQVYWKGQIHTVCDQCEGRGKV